MDKKQKVQKQKLFASRKFKYGAAATVFTVFFIAVVILFNVIVSAVDAKYSLYFDLTDDQIFSISENSVTMVDSQFAQYREVYGEDPQITVRFFAPRDIIMDEEQKSWVVNLVESYAEKYSQIKVEYNEDLNLHPEKYAFYKEKYQDDFSSSSIIISNDLEKGSIQHMTFDSCLVYDEEGSYVWAFQGEMKINAAIIKLTSQKSPVASFTVGHGESAPQVLTEILQNCGFTIKNVDLAKEDVSEDTKILIMSNPQKDITYSENDALVTEYTKISNYLNSYRSLMVIMSPTTPALPALDELLEDWGMRVTRNQVVIDDIQSIASDHKKIYANYTDSESVAGVLTESLTSLSSPPRTLCINSAPVEILDPGGTDLGFVTEAILTSSDNSYTEVVTKDGTEQVKGPFNLMAIASRFTIKNNVDTYGHLMVIGSEQFTELAMDPTYGNSDIVRNMIRLLSDEDIAMDVNYKVIEDYAIDIESGEVYAFGIVTAIVIPVIIFVFGTVVYVKRKHM
ncbi:MAG: Gldg family protein [Clostridia bacterium]|nr:Gldg family protein [Clostridia bacterium]